MEIEFIPLLCLIAFLTFVMATIATYFCTRSDSLVKFEIKEHPTAQLILRWCWIATGICCIGEAAIAGHNAPDGILLAILLFPSAFLCYLAWILVWEIVIIIFLWIEAIIHWACGK